MKKIFASVLPLLLLAFGLSAQEASENEALGFSRIDRNPATAGMAGAGLASTGEVSWAALRNSAVIPFMQGTGAVSAGVQSWAPKGAGSTNVALGGAFKLGPALGLSFAGSYDMSKDEYGSGSSTFKPSDLQVALGAGFAVAPGHGAGVNVRYLQEKLGDDSMSAVAADLTYTGSFEGFTVAAGLANIGSKAKLGKYSYKIPSSVTAGGTYDGVIDEQNHVLVALDADYFLSGNLTAALGAQYSWSDMVFVRAGFHYGSEGAVLPSFATFGAGFKYEGLRIDLAFLTANDAIGNTLTFGIGYSF